jgi:transposase-like protein
MNTDKEIKKLERQIAALKAKSQKQDARRKKTALRKVMAVVKRFGFDSVHQLLEVADTAAVAVSTKRKRAKITTAIRKKVVELLRSGHTVKATAEKTGISSPSVNIIKARAGLTKSRKAPKKAVAKKRAKLPRKAPAAPVESPAVPATT